MTMTSDSHQAFAPRAGFWKSVVATWNRYLHTKTNRELRMLASSGNHALRDLGVRPEDLKEQKRLPSALDAATQLEILSLRR